MKKNHIFMGLVIFILGATLPPMIGAQSRLDGFDWPKNKYPGIPLETTLKNVKASFNYLESFPESSWTKGQRNLHKKLLAKQKYDIVVAPFQTRGFPIDHIGRSLMTRYFVDGLESRFSVRVSNPSLLELGTARNDRAIDIPSVYEVANKTNAHTIIWGYVGHNSKGRFTVSIEIQQGARGKLSKKVLRQRYTWPSYSFTDTRLPSEVFLQVRKQIFNKIALKLPVNKTRNKKADVRPKSVQALTKMVSDNSASPLAVAYRLQVMGSLIPAENIRLREQFFERSLVALTRVNRRIVDYRLLKSRAYFALYRRPAALKAALPVTTNALKAMVARLNGNLPSFSQYVQRIRNPSLRVMAEIERADLRQWYWKSIDRAKLNKIANHYSAIKFLFTRRLHDADNWYVQNNLQVKLQMERFFPLPEYTAKSIVKSEVVLGKQLGNKMFDIAVYRHYRYSLLQHENLLIKNSWQPSRIDHLRIYAQLGLLNVLKGAGRRKLQGLYSEGIQELDVVNDVYAEHPRVLVLRSKLLDKQIKNKQRAEKSNIVSRIGGHMLNAFVWGGNTEDNDTAYYSLNSISRNKSHFQTAKRLSWRELAALNLYYESQFPMRWYWRPSRGPQGFLREAKLHKRKLKYSDYDFSPYRTYYSALSSEVRNTLRSRQRSVSPPKMLFRYPKTRNPRMLNPAVVLKRNKALAMYQKALSRQNEESNRKHEAVMRRLERKLNQRFIGNPLRYSFIEKRLIKRKDSKGLMRHYRSAIAQKSVNWRPYNRLAQIEIIRSRYDQAERILWSYPPFHMNLESERVGLANNSSEAGSMFYWRGDVRRAQRFYSLSTGFNTGSESEMMAVERNTLMKNDFHGAARQTLGRVRRYGSSYSYRDYMSWLHTLGYSSEAWTLFDSLLPRQSSPQIWASAFVGHRVNQTSEKDIVGWVNQKILLGQTKDIKRKGARYLFMALVLDRAVNPRVEGHIKKLGVTKIGFDNSSAQKYLRNDFFIKFVKGYNFLREKKYKNANRMLSKSSLPTYRSSFRYILTYATWAALNAKDSRTVARIKKSYSENSYFGKNDWSMFSSLFYRDIAFAYIKAFEKKHGKAVLLLKRAFNRRPHTGNYAIFTWYQIVEACELLYEKTGRDEYRRLALKWARAYQKIRPMYAWAYAVEAKYSRDRNARVRALGYALYLDKNSERIRNISKGLKRDARKYLKVNNLFKKRRPAKKVPREARFVAPQISRIH